MPCSSWTTRSPTLRSRKSERKERSPRRRPRACRCTSSGNTSPSASTTSPASGTSKPRDSAPTRVRIRVPSPTARPSSRSTSRQAVGAPGVAEEDDRGGRAVAQVRGEPCDVPRVARRGTRGDVEGFALGLDLAHGDDRRPGQVLRERLERDRAPPTLPAAGPRRGGRGPRAPAPRGPRPPARTASGSTSTIVAPGRCCHGGTVAPGTSGSSSARPSGARPRSSASRKGSSSRRSAKRCFRTEGKAASKRAGREQVGERERLEGLDRCGRALRVGVEAAQALHGVGEELDPHRLRRVRGEHVEDAAPARHLTRGRHGVLARVAALVERLEQDLRRHLVAHAHVQHARREQVRGEARAQQAEGRGDDGAGAPAPCAARRRAAPGRPRGAAGRETGAARGPAAPGPRPRCPAAAASVRRSCAVSSTSRSRGTTTSSGPSASSSGRNARERPRRAAELDASPRPRAGVGPRARLAAPRAGRARRAGSRAADARDDRRRRAARDERDADHAAAGLLDLGAPDDLVRGPVGALHQHVGPKRPHHLDRGVLVVDHDLRRRSRVPAGPRRAPPPAAAAAPRP